jgi:hypothetical protein
MTEEVFLWQCSPRIQDEGCVSYIQSFVTTIDTPAPSCNANQVWLLGSGMEEQWRI